MSRNSPIENVPDGQSIDFLQVMQLIEDRSEIMRGTRRIQKVLEHLGNPQDRIPLIMVGGTNGKTSTSYFIAQLLRKLGFRVGLFTSPNPVNRLRSIQISGELITQQQFRNLIMDALVPDVYLTGFELEVCAAYQHFSGKYGIMVDLAVMEMGMGGKGDAVNVRSPDIAVITNISNDHSAFLGNTIPMIALEKGDIIPVKKTLITGATPPALDVLKEIAEERDTKIIIPDFDRYRRNNRDNILGYQTRNLALAMETVNIFIETSDFPKESGDHRKFNHQQGDLDELILDLRPPQGRFQLRELDNDIFTLLDGAHNRDGFSVLFHEIFNLVGMKKPRKIVVVMGIMSDKDITGMAMQTSELEGKYICCRSTSSRAADPEFIAEKLRIVHDEVTVVNRVCNAIDAALEYLTPSGGLMVITGSLYTVEEALQYLDEK